MRKLETRTLIVALLFHW